MELVFTWPEGAPDFSVRDYYLRGELQVWPDGVDEEGNPVTITQRFTGHAQSDITQKWVKLGGAQSPSFTGLSYDIELGVIIQVHDANGAEGSDADKAEPPESSSTMAALRPLS